MCMKLPKDLRRHYQMRRSGFKCLEVGGFRVQGLGRFVPCDARAIAEAGNLEALQRDLVQKGLGGCNRVQGLGCLQMMVLLRRSRPGY